MTEHKHSDLPKDPRVRDSAKKPYLKPAFRHEQVFETMALACGKKSATQASCRVSRKNS